MQVLNYVESSPDSDDEQQFLSFPLHFPLRKATEDGSGQLEFAGRLA